MVVAQEDGCDYTSVNPVQSKAVSDVDRLRSHSEVQGYITKDIKYVCTSHCVESHYKALHVIFYLF